MSKKKKKDTTGTRGEIRKAHFAAGGSLSEWRGKHVVHTSKKDKRSGNRSQRKKKAIKDSQD